MIHTLFSSLLTHKTWSASVIHSFVQHFYDVLWFLLCAIGKDSSLKKTEKYFYLIFSLNIYSTFGFRWRCGRRLVQFKVLKQLWMQLTLFIAFETMNRDLAVVPSEITSWISKSRKNIFYDHEKASNQTAKALSGARMLGL